MFFEIGDSDDMNINISWVVELKRWWVLKTKIFGQESTPKEKVSKIPTGNVSSSKIGHNFRKQSGSKLSLEKNVFTKLPN